MAGLPCQQNDSQKAAAILSGLPRNVKALTCRQRPKFGLYGHSATQPDLLPMPRPTRHRGQIRAS